MCLVANQSLGKTLTGSIPVSTAKKNKWRIQPKLGIGLGLNPSWANNPCQFDSDILLHMQELIVRVEPHKLERSPDAILGPAPKY